VETFPFSPVAKPTYSGSFILAAYDRAVFEELVAMADSSARMIVGVDDDLHVRESLDGLVESAGFASFVFPSGEEFLRSGKLSHASCLIADIRMPGMDGIELQLRVRLERPELPVIFISGHFDDEIRRKALAGGAFALIDKPFAPDDLLAAIHEATSKFAHG
jgi:FixJ family two-component response regulator